MTRNGYPISDHGVKDGVATGIAYSLQYEIYAAIKDANLDLWKYEHGEYPKWFIANVLVHWRMSRMIELHSQDAVARKTAKK